jgi:hypothetical protein
MKKSVFLKLTYIFTNISYIIFNLVVGAFVIFAVLFTNKIIPANDLQITTAMPITFNFENQGFIQFDNFQQEIKIIESTGKIKFVDTNPEIAKYIIYAMSIVIFIMFYILHSFRNFIKNIYKSSIFEVENIKYLKRIAYSFLAGWLYYVIYINVFFYFLITRIEISNIKFSSDINYHGEFLIFAAFLWIIVHIIETGLNLKKENELTI